MLSTLGPQVADESGLKRLCRLQQSWYRAERLGNPAYGPHKPGGRVVGSALLEGELTGDNFISQAVLAYVREKLEEKRTRNPDLTIERFRLFNNMLSSQPMCFNLFSDLRSGVLRSDDAAARIVRAMFEDVPIATVDAIEVENLPQPLAEYIKDKTAFDASIHFTDPAGAPGIVTIETKYTDALGKGSASEVKHQVKLMEDWELCTPAGLDHFRCTGIPQIARNLLLTIAVQKRHGLSFATNFVVGLQEDASVSKAVAALRARLAAPYQERVQVLQLEGLVMRARKCSSGVYDDVFQRFWERYLDFDRARALLR